MARRISVWRKLLDRWSRQQETALWQMTERKTARKRIMGFSKSERIDAKFFLLAVVPFVPVMVSDQLGWSRGVLWQAWFWLSAVWAISIVAVGFASYWRAFRRSLRRKPLRPPSTRCSHCPPPPYPGENPFSYKALRAYRA